MVHAGCTFVTGIHPSRTWMSGSLESVRWDTCVHRLELGLYIRKSFGGMESETKLTPRENLYRRLSRYVDTCSTGHMSESRRTQPSGVAGELRMRWALGGRIQTNRRDRVHMRKGRQQTRTLIGHRFRAWAWGLLLLADCLTSQQHSSASKGRNWSDNCTCCHTEIEVADQICYLTQPQYTDTKPASPSAGAIKLETWQGSHWRLHFSSIWVTHGSM